MPLSNTDYTNPDTLLSSDDAIAGEGYDPLLTQFALLQRTRSAQANALAAVAALGELSNGVVAYNEWAYTTQPVDTNTMTIGGLVFEFAVVATNVYVTAANVGVVVSTVNANGTYDNLVAAFNATYGGVAGQHPVLLQGPATTTPALANSTKNLFAVHVPGGANDGTVYVFNAVAPGGAKVEGSAPSLAFSDTVATDGPWKFSNLNLSTGSGFAATTKALHGKHAIVAGDLTAVQPLKIPVSFTPQSWNVQVRNAAGVLVPDAYVAVSVPTAITGQAFLGLNINPTSPTTVKRKEFVLPLGAAGIATHFEWNPPRGVIPTAYKFVRGATFVGATLTIALDRITRSSGAVQAALSTATSVVAGTNDVEQTFTPSTAISGTNHAVADTQGLKGTLKPDATATAPGSVTFIVEYYEIPIATDVIHFDVYGA